jgi:site-specific recombinase XerD
MNSFFDAELVLFFNSTDQAGVKAGAPCFFLRSSHEIVLFEEATRFLSQRFVQAGGSPSPHTWAKVAYSLKSWFQFLQAGRRYWKDACEQDRLDFRNAYLHAISPKTGRNYGAAGIRDSMATIRSFYQFCGDRGLCESDITAELMAVTTTGCYADDPLIHSRSSRERFTLAKDLALPKVTAGVKLHPLKVQDLKLLLRRVGPRASERQEDLRLSRDRLICDLGWAVGLRLSEINALTTLQFLALVPNDAAPFVNMGLTIYSGKGGKTRQVAVPAWLVTDILAYISGERADTLKTTKHSSKKQETCLLLGTSGCKNAGLPITNSSIQKMFRSAVIKIGLCEVVEKRDPESRKVYTEKVPKHSIHDLRHTYAVLTYHAERMNVSGQQPALLT